MADTKLSDLSSGAPAAATDIIYAVKDPSGTPADAKLTLGEVKTLVNTPGGSDTQVQFNDSGAFAGDSGFTFNKTAKALTLTGATITTSSPVIDAAQTWNASGTTFTGLKLNVTDTSSASGSLLMDLQTNTGGAPTSRFNVDKSGNLAATGYFITSASQAWISSAVLANARLNGSGLKLYSGLPLGWTGTSDSNDALDTILTRRGAANLRLGAADAASPVAQTLSVQSVVAGTTNTAGVDFTLTASQSTGNARGGAFVFQNSGKGTAGTGLNSLVVSAKIIADNVFNIGAVCAPIIGSSFSGSGSTDLRISTAADIYFISGTLDSAVSYATLLYFAGGTSPRLRSNATFGWSDSTTNAASTLDTILARDAPNTLALRNGASAQTFNIYNTYTSSTDYERFSINAQSAAAVLIGTNKGSGGGTARALEFQTNGTTRLTIAATTGNITTTGLVSAATGNNGSITYGAAGTTDGFTVVGGNVTGIVSAGQYAVYIQRGVPAAVQVRSDDGFGWGTGAANTTTGLVLRRDVDNVLAQRNGNNGQIFRLYGRFTDITNDFERFFINAPTTSGAAVQLGTQKGATTGAARALEFQTDGTTRLTIASTSGNITTTGSVTTEAPTGGTAAAWRLGTVATVSPTSPNRTIEVDIGGTIYYISAKTTND